MPKSCCVAGCTAKKGKVPNNIKFYIFPQEQVRRKKWMHAINRAQRSEDGSVDRDKCWSPRSAHTYVCSQHFLTGTKVNDPDHPDYVPSLFPTDTNVSQLKENKEELTRRVERYERASKRKARSKGEIQTVKRRLQLDRVFEEFGIGQANDTDADMPAEYLTCTGGLKNLPEETLIPDKFTSTDVPEGAHNNLPDEAAEEDIDTSFVESSKTESVGTTPIQQPLNPSEREMFIKEMTALRLERDQALERAEKNVLSSPLSSSSVEDNDEMCIMMTGITWSHFTQVFLFLVTIFPNRNTKSSLPLQEELFLTLVRLRHNTSFDLLAHLTGLPKSTIIDHFWKIIDVLHANLDMMVQPQDREGICTTIPPVFKGKFPRLTCIIDCFEIFIEAPKNLLARAKCYSQYKKHCTIKFLISCSPLGAINFISSAWGGKASDNKIVRESGFISNNIHMPGDQILADRGFTLKDDFSLQCGAELLTPAFKKPGCKQMQARELQTSRKIASVRIHIERVIGLLKNRYTILKGTMPLRKVQSIKGEGLKSTLACCDKIIQVCCALVNLGPGIVFKEN